MKRRLLIALVAMMGVIVAADACTSAIVSGKLTANGRPMIWKNRDTNDLNNRVERIVAHDGLMSLSPCLTHATCRTRLPGWASTRRALPS